MPSNFTVQYDAVDLPKGATAQARRLKVAWRGRPIAAFSQSAHRTYVYPVFTPAGVPVTGEMPIDHPHHNSLTVGADHFNCHFQYAGDRVEDGTYNFYINDIFQGRAPGRTLAVSTDSRELSERHLQGRPAGPLAGPGRVGRARQAHSRHRDPHDRHPPRRRRERLRPALPTHAHRVGRLNRPNPACLLHSASRRRPPHRRRRRSPRLRGAPHIRGDNQPCRALGGRNRPRALRTPRRRGRRPTPVCDGPPLGPLRLGHHSRQPVPRRQLRPEAGRAPSTCPSES